ncbi:MAG: 3-oxoacyl-[acyl-carrier-protein] reductase [Saprospiraceae bacterium]|nr:3-oxoacyl-[acyl-carrier-protein] reductase [Saprospiraceae bacterium]
MYNLKNKVAVITGGAAGIGKATVEKFAEGGVSVAIWDVAVERGEALATELNAKGCSVRFFNVNTADNLSVTNAVSETLAIFGKIDILVNNAGITRDATLIKMTDEQWDQVLDINLKGVFNCTRAIAPGMVANGWGRIINASSVVGLYGNFGQTNYAATKAGVIAMTKTWAKELGKKGINVNAVAPGFILTEMVQAMPPEVLAKMAEKVPVHRLGKPEDIANIYAFLASDKADYINGATISVDGGITL